METIIRVAVIYLFVLMGMRFLGKREFGQLSPVELVTLMLIPEIVSQAIQREDYSLTNALVGVSTLFVLVFTTSLLMHRSKRIEEMVSGSPVVLVHKGQMNHAMMNKERVSPDDLVAEMRLAGLESLDDVRWAILEADGKISVIGHGNEPQPAHKKSDETAG